MLTRAGLGLAVMIVSAQAQSIELGLPIACDIGKDCWVQQYVDHDPGPAAKDYVCGTQAYDGHDGTDIRVRDTSVRGVAVLAAAPGTIKAIRNDMPDLLIRNDSDRALVKDKECGNGVVIDHDGGWQTQYCHLRVGSVKVAAGDTVEQGAELGEVGYSGLVAFPHVHLTVRKDGKPVDPFRPHADPASCGAMAESLWAPEVQTALAYHRGDVIGVGFAPAPVEMPMLEEGKLDGQSPDQSWPAMVAYVWNINLQKGDEIRISISGPGDIRVGNADRLDRSKAQYMLFAGQKRPAGGWARGDYVARAIIIRNGETAMEKEVRARID